MAGSSGRCCGTRHRLVAVSHFEADTLSAQARLGGKPVTVIRNGGTLPPPPFPEPRSSLGGSFPAVAWSGTRAISG